MKTSKRFCFKHVSGEDIYLFSLKNSKGTEVLISNYGAIINSFNLKDPDGNLNDIVLGFDKMEDYVSEDYLSNYPWFGAAIGRYANRIKGARFSIDDKTYSVTKNNNEDHLHGGKDGFDKKIWKLLSLKESPNASLELEYTSPDGEEGYPGNLRVILRFELNDNDELSYEFTATTDKPTAVNLTHHGYFNLDNDKKTIEEHFVKIYGEQILSQDVNFVVTGNFVNVKNTPFDFTEWKKVSHDWNAADGYDQSYVLKNTNESLNLVAEVYSAKSKTKLQVWSTEPVVHFYTGRWIPSVKGKLGDVYGRFSALCLETQIHPNAINIPGFPNTILRPGNTYHHKTIYKIFQKVEK